MDNNRQTTAPEKTRKARFITFGISSMPHVATPNQLQGALRIHLHTFAFGDNDPIMADASGVETTLSSHNQTCRWMFFFLRAPADSPEEVNCLSKARHCKFKCVRVYDVIFIILSLSTGRRPAMV